MPLTVGALLGGTSRSLLEGVRKYGEPIGLAFQIRDDILGVYGDSRETGKSIDSDICEGKKTLLYFNALNLAKPSEQKFLKNRYGKKDLTKKEIEKIKEIIKDSGALQSSQLYAQKMVNLGKKYISKITTDPDYAQTLASLADYMILREK